MMIKIEKLIHDYIKRDDEGNVAGTFRAISGVDLNVEAGQFIAILGHNGSGKSTLAKHLNALLFPTEGAVWVDGLNTKDEKNLWEIRRDGSTAKNLRTVSPADRSREFRSPASLRWNPSALFWTSRRQCWIQTEEKKS